jgi:hypothetical protein
MVERIYLECGVDLGLMSEPAALDDILQLSYSIPPHDPKQRDLLTKASQILYEGYLYHDLRSLSTTINVSGHLSRKW